MASALDFYKSYEFVAAYVQTAGGAISGTGTATNTISSTAHGLNNGDIVVPTAAATFTGVSVGGRYAVVNSATNSFKLAATVGGSAIAIGDTGSITVKKIVQTELDWANKIAASTDKNTFEWVGSAQAKKIETIKQITLTLDLDCIPTAAHGTIFGKTAASGLLPGNLTASTTMGFGGGNDKSGVAAGLLLEGYGLKGATESVKTFGLWYPLGILSLVSAPGFNAGATGDKFQYSFAASRTLVDVCGGTVSGISSDGEIYITGEIG